MVWIFWRHLASIDRSFLQDVKKQESMHVVWNEFIGECQCAISLVRTGYYRLAFFM